jgi:hypothetical protein
MNGGNKTINRTEFFLSQDLDTRDNSIIGSYIPAHGSWSYDKYLVLYHKELNYKMPSIKTEVWMIHPNMQ